MIENANPWGDIRSHRALHVAAGRLRGNSAGVQVAVAWWADDESLELAVVDDLRESSNLRRPLSALLDVTGVSDANPELDLTIPQQVLLGISQ
jgi:hypothetical protein